MNTKSDFRIIIIDDNPQIHQDFIKILTNVAQHAELDNLDKQLFGKKTEKVSLPAFQIDTATQGKEGVAYIKKAMQEDRPYALAFVDIRMPPGWDGITTIKHIWEIDKDIQIIICTAYSDYSWEETISQLGHTDNLLILKKPFDNIAVRQLACALTKKWQLLQDSRSHMNLLESKILERTKLLEHQATHDTLTQLPNRVLLERRLQEAILEGKKNKKKFAVFFFDLDRFKLINDSLNHSAGDELLQAVAKRLQKHLPTNSTLSRLGGDEFVVLLKNIKSKNYIVKILTDLLNAIHEPFKIAKRTILITTSIGVSLFPEDGTHVSTLLRNADAAMYHSKRMGANRYEFYNKKLIEKNLEELEKETLLRQALRKDELYLCYQPQIDLHTGELIAVEALVRWNNAQHGIILPMDFVPLAEETGLIVPIGEWVIRNACLQNKKWQDQGFPPIRIAVNITSKQLSHYGLVDTVKTILQESKLDPKYLELELTENSIINNAEVINTINQLKELGIHIALDDFGTGYSSLNYLRSIPFDRLKIDRSFVQNIHLNHGDEVIIQAIITMARSLNLEVLAEGVETTQQLDFLKSHECSEIQGFYFSKPLSGDDLENILSGKTKLLNYFKSEKETEKT